MVPEYEENINLPPPEFWDGYKPILKPITKRNTVPVAVPRTKIEEKAKALKGYSKTFEISIRNYTDTLKQNTETRKAIYHKLTQELVESQKIINQISGWTSKVSGWIIISVNHHWISIVKYNPVNGSS